MAVNELLAQRVRSALASAGKIEEKRMFGGLTFMLDGKMCVSVGNDRIMCRIDPATHDGVVAREGCHPVLMRGRTYRGFVYVDAEVLRSKAALDRWIALALKYNPQANHRGARATT